MSTTPKPRPPSTSRTMMTELVLPPHGNAVGTAFGGTILSWIDVCAGIAAQRFCGHVAVTAAIDEMQFLAPVHVGDVVSLTGFVNASFNTSIEVEVIVEKEPPESLERTLCADAKLTFVAIDADGRPALAPPVQCETPEEHQRYQEALERRNQRLERKRSRRARANS
ncbi:MAG: acyl-CoA thioesterase [Myxococcota bacterium]